MALAGGYFALFETLFSGDVNHMIYLASQSPRRAELLKQIGVPFQKLVCDIDESPLENELPATYVQRMADQKARAGWSKVIKQSLPEQPLLASDTSVICDQVILGKPENEQAARDMLGMLSGRAHQVMTAIALTDGVKTQSQLVVTEVRFNTLSPQQISDYVATGEPVDKAGAYGIQGRGAVLVASISGSYSSVVGLPLSETAQMLAQFGVAFW